MVRIGIVQTSPRRTCRRENLEALAERLAGVEADLLVLPELCDTGYLFADRRELLGLATPAPEGETCAFLLDRARTLGCWLAGGFAELAGDRVYNSAALAGPDGTLHIYRKVHLFNDEKDIFAPGDLGFRVHDLGFARVGMMICFDWIFPESARTLALQGAQILLHPANLVLPWCQRAMETRCLENRVFAVTGNRVGTDRVGDRELTFTGGSQVVSPEAEVLLRAPVAEESLLVVEIEPDLADDKGVTPKNEVHRDRRPEYYL